MHTLPRLAVPLLLSGALLLAACGDDGEVDVGTGPGSTDTTVIETTTAPPPDTVDPDDPIAVLDFHRQGWDDAAITDYDLTYRPVCFCMASTVVVHVRGDEVTVDPPTEPDGYEVPVDEALTVEKMFDELDAAYRGSEADDREPAASVEVTYDDDWNFPSDAYIDWSEMMADEEFGWEVLSFDAIAGTGTDDEGDTTTTTTPSDTTPTTDIVPPPTQPPTTDPADGEAALAEARARWNAADITEYDLEYQTQGAWGGPRVRVHVNGDEVTVVEIDPPNDYDDETTVWTIDRMFDDLEQVYSGELPEWLADTGDDLGPGSATATYDAELGYPDTAHIDWALHVMDEEQGWEVISLVPTP